MRKKTRVFAAVTIVILAAAGIAACVDREEEAVQPAAQQPAAGRSESVFDPLVQSADRARAVQQTIDERAQEQRRQLERLEQAERPDQ